MNRQNFIFIIVALIVAGIFTYFILFWTDINKEDEIRRFQTDTSCGQFDVLVAAEDLQFGRVLIQKDLRWQKWPKETLTSEHVLKTTRKISNYVGGVLKKPINNGQPVNDADIIKPSHQGFLASLIHPGKRAISIDVDPSSGVAGFIFPGDYVDIIQTFLSDRQNRAFSSTTILTNLKILAIDQITSRKKIDKAKIAKTVTLEVTPEQAESIISAQRVGSLSLSLHGLLKDEMIQQNGNKINKSNHKDEQTL